VALRNAFGTPEKKSDTSGSRKGTSGANTPRNTGWNKPAAPCAIAAVPGFEVKEGTPP